MKLYYKKGACSLAPHIIAREIGLELELIPVDLQTGTLSDGTLFSTINPKGYVPTLQLDGGTVLTEGMAIDLYLAGLKPESTIAPKLGSVEYFEMVSWLTYIATEIHKNFYPSIAKLYGVDAGKTWLDFINNSLKQRFQLIEDQLEKTPYLMGDQFTCADVYLFVTVGWAPGLNFGLEDFPNIQKFHQTTSERPAVKAAMAAEA